MLTSAYVNLMLMPIIGQATLPPSCPVCEHTPVSGADCTVYKSLRTTIRVFLKTEEKRRETMRPKTNGSAPITPVHVTPTPTPTQTQGPADPPALESSAPELTNPEQPPDNVLAAATENSVEAENNPTSEDIITTRPDVVSSS